MNFKGQSSIEFVIVISSGILMTQVFLGMVYLSSFRLYFDFRSHEALLCAVQKSVPFCQAKFRSELLKFLVFGKLKSVRLEKNEKWVRGDVDLGFAFAKGARAWHLEDQLQLPLQY